MRCDPSCIMREWEYLLSVLTANTHAYDDFHRPVVGYEMLLDMQESFTLSLSFFP